MAKTGITLLDFCQSNDYMSLLEHLVDKDALHMSYASHTKVKWVCDKGHLFMNEIYKYTSKGRGTYLNFSCPICSGQRVERGINDLATIYPKYVKEWDFERNELSPFDVTAGSHRNVWWKCKAGHSWNARISARVYSDSGCPYCASKIKSSLGELYILYYSQCVFGSTVESRKKILGVEYDIFIPQINTAIEYDGYYWHSLNDTSYKKELAESAGINFIRVIEGTESYIKDGEISFSTSAGLLRSDFESTLSKLFHILGCDSVNIDLKRDLPKIKLMQKHSQYNADDFLIAKIAPFWDEEANGYPVEFVTNDGEPKLWRCKYGHSFERRLDVIKRFDNFVCPYCECKRRWRFYCFKQRNNLFVLDLQTLEVELCSKELLTVSVNKRINIRGVTVLGGVLSVSNDYLFKMLPTSFRETFKMCRNKSFVCLSDSQLCKDMCSFLGYCFSFSPEKSQTLFKDYLLTQ